MHSKLTIAAVALAPFAFPAAASAQYGGAAPPQQPRINVPQPKAEENSKPAPGERKMVVSKAAAKAIRELQAAVNANDVANLPAKLAAAQAVASSPDEKYVVAQLQLKAAIASKSDADIERGLGAMLASGGADQAQTERLYLNLGQLQYKNKEFPAAAASLEKVLATNPSQTDALVMLAETKKSLNQAGDAVSLLQRALKAKSVNGQKADEEWYKRAVAIAYEAQLPVAIELSRQWVAAYPSPGNWRDALRVYRKLGNPSDTETLDTLRLARAAGALSGDADFHLFAYSATAASSPGEARSLLDEAIAAKQIDPNKQLFKDITGTLKTNKVMARADLPQLAKEAMAASAARLAMRTGDAYYGYGDYAKAAELYRAALTKSGADANLINLHLGMALARAGDKAGATAALNAVTGDQSELAKFWLVYVATHT